MKHLDPYNSPAGIEYYLIAFLTVVNAVIILSGHSNDPGAGTLMGFLGLAFSAVFVNRQVERAAKKAANGTATHITGIDPDAEAKP